MTPSFPTRPSSGLPDRLMLANSGVLAIGALGALAVTAPVEALLGVTDWRTLFLGLAAVTVIVAAAVHTVVPERRDIPADGAVPLRSEEHTSELQSLMRNSYAVFCLRKKNKH